MCDFVLCVIVGFTFSLIGGYLDSTLLVLWFVGAYFGVVLD